MSANVIVAAAPFCRVTRSIRQHYKPGVVFPRSCCWMPPFLLFRRQLEEIDDCHRCGRHVDVIIVIVIIVIIIVIIEYFVRRPLCQIRKGPALKSTKNSRIKCKNKSQNFLHKRIKGTAVYIENNTKIHVSRSVLNSIAVCVSGCK